MRTSAGILMFRKQGDAIEFFLIHPGGPFWKGKETGAWSLPKGEFTAGEAPLEAATREFFEETGEAVQGNFIELTPVQQKGGKLVYAWAVEGSIDADHITSNTFKAEWPYRSGKWQSYPEVDKAGWFNREQAMQLINPAQAALIDELLEILSANRP